MRTLRELFATDDHKESAAAFIEKREPKYIMGLVTPAMS